MENEYIKHFDKELKLTETKINSFITDCIPEIHNILDKADKQGWSGGVAPFYIKSLCNTIEHALNFEPLTPLTNNPNEWTEYIENNFQNNRCSGVFCKDILRGPYHYINAMCKVEKWLYNMDTKLMEYPEQNYGSHGVFWMYNEQKQDWRCYSSFGYIRNLNNFIPSRENKEFPIPIIEFYQPSDTHNDFFTDISYMEFYEQNKKLIKTYRLKEIELDDELLKIKKYLIINHDLIMGWKNTFLKKYKQYE